MICLFIALTSTVIFINFYFLFFSFYFNVASLFYKYENQVIFK